MDKDINTSCSPEHLDLVTQSLKLLEQHMERQVKAIEEQASIIKKQHETISRYENDVIYKTQKDLIMELIGIADQLRYTLNDYAAEKETNPLYKVVEDLTEWVDGSLQSAAVRKYVSVESNLLDRKRQEVVEMQETDNLQEDGRVKSILPGYIWSVPMVGSNEMMQAEERPKVYEFIIRPEQVVCYKYAKANDNIQAEGAVSIPEDVKTPESIVCESNESQESEDSLLQKLLN